MSFEIDPLASAITTDVLSPVRLLNLADQAARTRRGVVSTEIFDANATMGEVGAFMESLQTEGSETGTMSLLALLSEEEGVSADLLAQFHVRHGRAVAESDLPVVTEMLREEGALVVATNKMALRSMASVIVAEARARSVPKPVKALSAAERRARWDEVPASVYAANNIHQQSTGIPSNDSAGINIKYHYDGWWEGPLQSRRRLN